MLLENALEMELQTLEAHPEIRLKIPLRPLRIPSTILLPREAQSFPLSSSMASETLAHIVDFTSLKP